MADYVELHCHSAFSLLDGASTPAALIERAALLGMDTLALTDHDAVYGAPQFAEAAAARGMRPIFGAELTVDQAHLTLLVEDETGWANLCWLITEARRDMPKGSARLAFERLDGHTAGLVALSGCRHGALSAALLRRDPAGALAAARRYQALFGRDRFYVELQRHLLPEDDGLIDALVDVATRVGAEVAATNNVHYAERAGHTLQDVLVCIRHNLPLDENPHLRANSEYYLKSAKRMAHLFADHPDALAATRRIAERCRYPLRGGLQDLPTFPTPGGQSAEQYLRELADGGARWRYGDVGEREHQQLTYELQVIGRAGLGNYFLIVWDIMRFAREQGILAQGRGSAANSIVAYVLGISPVDPIAHDLVFERFLSEERQSAPDIDMDFESPARREDVIQYIYQRWGRDHAAMACTFSTFLARSAIRDVGKALGLSLDFIDPIAKAVDRYGTEGLAAAPGLQDVLGDRATAPLITHLLKLCGQIHGLPRHVGIHNGAFVITGAPITSRLPTEPATMLGRTVVQWDKDGLESTGIVKIDVLGLRMLAAVAEAVRLVEARSGEKLDLDRLPFTDDKVFTAITDADTIGVFQVEFAGANDRAAASQAAMLQRPGHLDQLDPPRSRAGTNGASLPPSPCRGGTRHVPASADSGGAEGDAGRDAFSGAGIKSLPRPGGLHTGAGRAAAASAG